MNLHVELSHLIAAFVALVGAYWALVKVIVRQFEDGLDQRFDAQEEVRKEAAKTWHERFSKVEEAHKESEKKREQLKREFEEHLRTLPEKYQRREDAIRQEVAVISRLDGLAEMTDTRFTRMEAKIDKNRSS